ncbi:MAG: Mu-like prophage major head subunit gpT family protein [Desulfovibrio sp.]|jgi:phage major head subunit gpT-like protein|nr:Mu-like prophage major head subunit gpT family protein [Desulfovibrio sp.]
MAVVTNALLAALRTGFRGEFQRVFTETPSDYASIATLVSSSTASNTYGWLGQFPSLIEWIGERTIKSIKEQGYQIINKKYEATVGIPRTAIEDDELGIYKPLFAEMGRAAKVFPDQQCFSLLKAGAETLCYDGQNFFDTDHPVYPNVDGTGDATTVSNLSVVAGENAEQGAGWYLMDNGRALRPLIFQQRTTPELDALTETKDEAVFMTDQYRYGIRYRCNVGFSFWQLAQKSTLPLTEANFNTVYDAMCSLRADGNLPLGIRPTHLVVPTSLRTAAQEVVVVSRKANGADNPNAGIVKVIVTPWLN